MVRAFIIAVFIWLADLPAFAQNQSENRYASIIVDADTLEVLHARQIDAPRYPASLTKVMTLYLTFDALDAGTLKIDERLVVSKTAARTPPVKMGLKAGQAVSVDTLIQAVAVRSSNDAAVVLAERLGGSEAGFAEMMTAKARALGMQRTTFKTANGLPDPDQKTTARDMAKLANAILTHHQARYHYFGQKRFRGKYNTNKLLATRADVDGFKTGYTRASGYNLMVSATQNGRRLIAIVLGGASNDSRNQHMSDLIDRGFDVMSKQAPPVKLASYEPPKTLPKTATQAPVIVGLRGTNSRRIQVQTAGVKIPLPQNQTRGWTVQIKGFGSPQDAQSAARIITRSAGGTIEPRSGFAAGRPVYHARVSGLSAKAAKSACRNDDFALELSTRRCLIIAP